MRTPSIAKPDNVTPKQATERTTQTREYQLITPLFGGGVNPAEADPITVVRSTEIRGHLRFWWRATRGGHFNGDLGKMKEAEDALWGASSTKEKPCPSQVSIAILEAHQGMEDIAFQVVLNKKNGKADILSSEKIAPYGAFPLLPDKDQKRNVGWHSQSVRIDVKFTMTINYPNSSGKEVEAALWAWETFGGIGARTRRGFGALKLVNLKVNGCSKTLESSNSPKQFVENGLMKHVAPGTWPNNVPHLSTNLTFKTTSPKTDATQVWQDLIMSLKRFRQFRIDKNTGQRSDYGSSVWPEPKAIRSKVGSRGSAQAAIDKYPRAVFGLPIIFHFPQFRDIPDATLKGTTTERLASPLILKPLTYGANQVVGLAAILETPQLPEGGLILESVNHHSQVRAELNEREASTITPLRGNTKVLQAFLNWIEGEPRR